MPFLSGESVKSSQEKNKRVERDQWRQIQEWSCEAVVAVAVVCWEGRWRKRSSCGRCGVMGTQQTEKSETERGFYGILEQGEVKQRNRAGITQQ